MAARDRTVLHLILGGAALALLGSACAGGSAPVGVPAKSVQVRNAGSLGAEPPAAGLGADLGQGRGQNAAPPPPNGQVPAAPQQGSNSPALGAPATDRCSAGSNTPGRKMPLPACLPA